MLNFESLDFSLKLAKNKKIAQIYEILKKNGIWALYI